MELMRKGPYRKARLDVRDPRGLGNALRREGSNAKRDDNKRGKLKEAAVLLNPNGLPLLQRGLELLEEGLRMGVQVPRGPNVKSYLVGGLFRLKVFVH